MRSTEVSRREELGEEVPNWCIAGKTISGLKKKKTYVDILIEVDCRN